MKYYAPSYYKDFKCIADKCKHSCCIGWEIDIDDITYSRYIEVDGDFGERLKSNIDTSEESRCFRLGEGDRCPFLNERGLCDIITTLGEEYLSQICTDHPRFRSFFDDRVEIGLGLSCEEAARLILTFGEKVEICPIPGGGDEILSGDEEYLLSVRDDLFDIITDRSRSFSQRAEDVKGKYEIYTDERSDSEWAEFFLEKLEYMGEEMQKRLSVADKNVDFSAIPDTAWEQLTHYFLYRQLPDALYDDRLYERIAFCFLSPKIIRLMLPDAESTSLEALIDNARLFSGEIEYSGDNMNKILDELSQFV